jgi:hypothetical protein
MQNNKFEIDLFDGKNICFQFKSIVICNKDIKDNILAGKVEVTAPAPYIIITNDRLNDDEMEILEDASIADALSYVKAKPAFGGVLI